MSRLLSFTCLPIAFQTSLQNRLVSDVVLGGTLWFWEESTPQAHSAPF